MIVLVLFAALVVVLVLMHGRSHRRRTAEREAALAEIESSTSRQIAYWSPEKRERVADLLAELLASISAFHMIESSTAEDREMMYADTKRINAALKRLGRSTAKISWLATV